MFVAAMLASAAPHVPVVEKPAPYTLSNSVAQVVQAENGEGYRIMIAWP